MRLDRFESEHGWFSRERVLTILLGLSTFLALYACYVIVSPFTSAIALATAVAVATNPLQRLLRTKLKSNTAAAAVGVVLVACVLVIPLGLLVTHLIREIVAGVPHLQAQFSAGSWEAAIPVPPMVARALDSLGANLDLNGQLMRLGQFLASRAGSFLTGSINLVTQLVVMLFVLFFLYRDREYALNSLRGLLPLSHAEATEMFSLVANTIRATVNGSLTVAFVQAMLAGLMYTVLKVPGSMIWAAATFIVALVPVFGTVLVWGPIALFLLVSGSWVKAIILIVWGVLAVGTIDNMLYPHLVGGQLRLHTVPTFFAILGGVSAFGGAGLIIGPVILAITIGLVDVWRVRTSHGRNADEPLASPRVEVP